ncbi:hypothetical protein [Saccharicrinis aurantiacus]|uniref:hypothetical protein n=1 Tax=Saccharicrinis aurantiacus TaxID=1849719 RepID=UPI00248F54C3|nr:hypothetical protein [Saccharicrinis aurantiacus]
MKHILSILLACTLFFGCSKSNDNEQSDTNSISINNQDFKINTATMIGVSLSGSGHTSISLISGTGFQVNTLTIDVESFTKETITGNYSYPTAEGDKVLDDWLSSYASFNDSGVETTNLKEGEVQINHNSGNNYTLNMNLLMNDGTEFKGTYTGDFMVNFVNQ